MFMKIKQHDILVNFQQLVEDLLTSNKWQK